MNPDPRTFAGQTVTIRRTTRTRAGTEHPTAFSGRLGRAYEYAEGRWWVCIDSEWLHLDEDNGSTWEIEIAKGVAA